MKGGVSHMVIEDEEIIQLYFERNEKAIQATADKFGHYCNSIAYHILNNWEDTEECVADTYLKAWNSIPPNRPSVLRLFLGKITRNKAFDIYKKMNADKRGGGEFTIILDELAECVSGGSEPDKELDRKQMQDAINSFLGALSKEKCALFVRRYWYAESISEIAERYSMSENYVSVSLYRLRKKLHDYLIKRGFEL